MLSCNVVLILCFKVFVPPHILYRCSVFVFFLTKIRKTRYGSYKKRRPCFFVKYFNCGDYGWFACGFCVEGSNKRSDRGHSSNDLEFFTGRAFRASFSNFRKLIYAFHFFLATIGEEASQVDYPRALHQLNPHVEPLLLRIERSQLRLFRHVCRMCQKRVARQILLAIPSGGRSNSGAPVTNSYYGMEWNMEWKEKVGMEY